LAWPKIGCLQFCENIFRKLEIVQYCLLINIFEANLLNAGGDKPLNNFHNKHECFFSNPFIKVEAGHVL
jgi:hypothetical protein